MPWIVFILFPLFITNIQAAGCGHFLAPEQKLFTLAQFDLKTPLNELVAKTYSEKVTIEETWKIIHTKYITENSETPTYIIRKHRRDKISDADFAIISQLAKDYPSLTSATLLNEQTMEFSNGLVRPYVGDKTERILLQTSRFVQLQIPAKDFQEIFEDLKDIDDANWSFARLVTPNFANQ